MNDPGVTRSAWVLAHPVGHSLSPVMQGAAFLAMGVDARYGALDVTPEDLPAAFERLRAPDVLGANLSLPHKHAALRLVDAATAEAEALGAVNTVVNEAGRLLGANTDVGGFIAALLGLAPELAGGGFRAVTLGAGGAARAVVWGLVRLGGEVGVVNRDPERAEELVRRLERAGLPAGRAKAVLPRQLDLRGADLLVNTTSVGMAGGGAPAELPLLARWEFERLEDRAVVSDLVYRPARTPLLALAAERGLRHQNGVAMLVEQGAEAFELWTGLAAPREVMRRAVDGALEQDELGRGRVQGAGGR